MPLSGGRLAFERAIRRSDLPAPARHVALTIATWADIGTGVIPERFQPSISTLAEATGMSATTVKKHLTVLETAGWLLRDRPDIALARTEHARTQYALMVPPVAQGHGRETTMPRSGDDHAMGASRPRHSREAAKAWSGDDHKSSCSSDEVPENPSTSPAEPVDTDPQSDLEPTDGGGGGSDLRSIAIHIAASLDYQGKPPTGKQRQLIEDRLLVWLEAGWSMDGLAVILDIAGQGVRHAPTVYALRLDPEQMPAPASLPVSSAGGSIRGRVASAAEFEAATVDSFYGPARRDTADGGMWERAMDRARQRMGGGASSGGTDDRVAGWRAVGAQLAAREAHRPYSNDVWSRPATPAETVGIPWCGDVECEPIGRMRERVDDNGLKHDEQCPKCHPNHYWGAA